MQRKRYTHPPGFEFKIQKDTEQSSMPRFHEWFVALVGIAGLAAFGADRGRLKFDGMFELNGKTATIAFFVILATIIIHEHGRIREVTEGRLPKEAIKMGVKATHVFAAIFIMIVGVVIAGFFKMPLLIPIFVMISLFIALVFRAFGFWGKFFTR